MKITKKPPKGSWKMQCDQSGVVYYSGEMVRQSWNNLEVHKDIYEPQFPQDQPLMTRERGVAGINPLRPSIAVESAQGGFDSGFSGGFDI